MKICIISSTILSCPPMTPDGKSYYGGLEMIAYQQAVGLSKNHEVLLIAPNTSKVPNSVQLHGTTLGESEKQAYSGYWQKLNDYQIILDNSWHKYSYILKMEGKLKAPILGILHAPVNTMYSSPPPVEKPCLVAISKDQAEHTKEHLKCDVRVCLNGVDPTFYKPLNMKRNDRYLFLARISTIKGPDIAIDVCRNSNVGLDLVGDDKITGEDHFVREIKNKCIFTPKIRYIGNQHREMCTIWFNNNYALLHPNLRYRESFGLAPVESQLCGMPVISYDYGAMRETIKHKETGFLVNSQQEMEELIKSDAVSSIKRERCREWAMQFSVDNMVKRYESLCIEAIESGGW